VILDEKMTVETTMRNMVEHQPSIVVGLGEMEVTRLTSAVLSCLGIGSCMVVCVYDGLFKIGGMAHIVLPSHDGKSGDNLIKYADTGVPLLINEVIKQGGNRSRLTIKIAGGAQMSLAPGLINSFKTGERNLEGVKTAIGKEGIPLVAADVGGNKGRTVRMHINTGMVIVKTTGDKERVI
jgi:chemotaxis protein CheD